MKTLYELLGQPTRLIDSHCHLNAEVFDEDRDELVSTESLNDVSEVWDISVDVESSRKSIELSKKYKNIRSFIGIDPELFVPGSEMFVGFENAEDWIKTQMNEIRMILEENREQIIGIGESGMDFYWFKEKSEEEQEESKKYQEKLFRAHLELAEEFELPLSIHSRGAEEDCLGIVKNYKTKGIFHSYTGSLETARKILEEGWGLGVNGIYTFKNAKEIREMYSELLKDKEVKSILDLYKAGIYFETDAPYLAPEGKRGERNVPGNVKDVYEQFQIGN